MGWLFDIILEMGGTRAEEKARRLVSPLVTGLFVLFGIMILVVAFAG